MSPKKKVRAEDAVKDESGELKKEEKDEDVKEEEADATDVLMKDGKGEDGEGAATSRGSHPPPPLLEDLQPSNWFRKKLQDWRKDLGAWHEKHVEYKSPNKKALSMGALCKAAPATKPEPLPEKKEAQPKKKAEVPVDDGKDPMQQLEEEMDREEIDIFGLQDVYDIGDGTPLFAEFAFEDWALLSLRFELHLLVHALIHDANDAGQLGIHPEHLAFYYNKYYNRGLTLQKYGVASVDELIDLVKDTVLVGARTHVLESLLTADVECNEVFIKLTEGARRDRQRRIDAGEEQAALKFSRPSRGVPGLMAGDALGLGKGGGPVIVRPKQWNAKAAGGGFKGGMTPPVKAPPPGGGNSSWQRMPGGYNNSWGKGWRG